MDPSPGPLSYPGPLKSIQVSPAPPASGTTTGSIRRWSHGRWNLHQSNHPMPIKNHPKSDIQSPNTRQKMIQNRWKSMRVSILCSSGFVTNQRPGGGFAPYVLRACAYVRIRGIVLFPMQPEKVLPKLMAHWKIPTTPIGKLPPPPLDIYHHPHWIYTTTLIENLPPPHWISTTTPIQK